MTNDARKTVCLVMIVKNEEAVIRRCLESAKPFFDYWVIWDTGSSDGTIRIVQEVLRDVPGELHKGEWVSFGHNRSMAIAQARGKADYHLVVDADMTVEARDDWNKHLTADGYLIRFRGKLEYYLPLLVSDRHQWRHIGVTHEYIHSDTARSFEKRPEISVTHHCDGRNRADKFQRDIRLLTEALKIEPENGRHMFYLAQSYRDIGLGGQAVEWYARRVAQGG